MKPVITGLGVTAAVGQGKAAFWASLVRRAHAFDVLRRPGRQRNTSFLGAEITDLALPTDVDPKVLRGASFSARVALATIHEAWAEARLDELDPVRVGLVVGGSNVQQRELVRVQEEYGDRLPYLAPSYGMSFMDSDLCGVCSQHFGIRGCAYTVGGASASGQLAIIAAARAVEGGEVDACVAVGALTDLSYWECQGFRALGAMGSDRFADAPSRACRPFDRERDGFIFGEGCGVVVVESAESARRRCRTPYGVLRGRAVRMDANRNPNPSWEGELEVIQAALADADLRPREISYVNPHGTGSVVGDEAEVRAIKEAGLGHAYVNSTKSIVGHALSAAGAIEAVATLLQMRAGKLHPSRNLDDPLDGSLAWVRQEAVEEKVRHALSLSIGFGGLNTALCFDLS
jgi:malonyl-ACP decarboxylase